MATMRDVAEHAGVSVTTVSHVLNESRYVSDELRERVQTAMHQLGYKRNLLARGLRRGQTFTLGMIVGFSFNPFFFEVARGVEAASYEQDYNVILGNAEGNPDKEFHYINVLIEKQVDGLVLATAGIHAEHIEMLHTWQVPFVLVDREIPSAEADLIRTDHESGAWQAANHLTELGHRRIACITGPLDIQNTTYRLKGYEKALTDAGIPVDTDLIVTGDWNYDSGYQLARELLDRAAPPTAIFAFNDIMAVGAMRAIIESGRRVPDDVAVVGFDDIPLASYAIPSLTTVRQPMQALGRVAVTRLFERMENPDLPAEKFIMQPELVIRMSSTKTRM